MMGDDRDGDGIADGDDNCPDNFNPNQEPEACAGPCPSPEQGDRDGDGIEDERDNCPDTCNPLQFDFDGDGTGDACEA